MAQKLALHALISNMTLADDPAVRRSAGFTMQKMTKVLELYVGQTIPHCRTTMCLGINYCDS